MNNKLRDANVFMITRWKVEYLQIANNTIPLYDRKLNSYALKHVKIVHVSIQPGLIEEEKHSLWLCRMLGSKRC